MFTRRMTLAGAGVAGIAGFAAPSAALMQAGSAFDGLMADSGGQLKLAAVDTANGHRLLYNAEARSALCSTFKMLLGAAILEKVDRGELAFDKQIRFTSADILEYAPVVKENAAKGALPIDTLCAAAISLSDNSAANLLLPQIGGPGGLTRFLRRHNDDVTRLDRNEPSLNDVAPDDPRDTTTPLAMIGTMHELLIGNVLTPQSRERLIGWMVACKTGDKRLRAGLPRDWRVGDKTGTGPAGEYNDVAIAYPPGRKPILIASYLKAPDMELAAADAVHAKVGALVGRVFSR